MYSSSCRVRSSFGLRPVSSLVEFGDMPSGSSPPRLASAFRWWVMVWWWLVALQRMETKAIGGCIPPSPSIKLAGCSDLGDLVTLPSMYNHHGGGVVDGVGIWPIPGSVQQAVCDVCGRSEGGQARLYLNLAALGQDVKLGTRLKEVNRVVLSADTTGVQLHAWFLMFCNQDSKEQVPHHFDGPSLHSKSCELCYEHFNLNCCSDCCKCHAFFVIPEVCYKKNCKEAGYGYGVGTQMLVVLEVFMKGFVATICEIMEFAPGSFPHVAQIFSCLIWNHQFCVIRWIQGKINMIHTYFLTVKGRSRRTTDPLDTIIGEVLIAESKSYLHNLYLALMHIVGTVLYANKQGLLSKFSCTWLSWIDEKQGVDTIPVVRVDPPAVDDNAVVEVPQIQQRGLLSLSSVSDNQYLQLSTPLPQMPDRLLGEPPAGHQLVCVIEAFEDCSCGTFGSDLLTDGRWPFGFFGSLQCRYLVVSLAIFVLCLFCYLYLALIFGATMYSVR